MMTSETWWLCSAHSDSTLDRFEQEAIVAIGTHLPACDLSDEQATRDWEEVAQEERQAFYMDMQRNDRVVAAGRKGKVVLIGRIVGPYTFRADDPDALHAQRTVEWDGRRFDVPRESYKLNQPTDVHRLDAEVVASLKSLL